MSKDKGSNKRGRSASPNPTGTVDRDDLGRIVSEAMAAQLPRLIMETSKVVTEQLGAEMRDRDDSSRSLSNFTQEMKQMKLCQEEIRIQTKAAGLKSDGKKEKKKCLFPLSLLSLSLSLSYLHSNA